MELYRTELVQLLKILVHYKTLLDVTCGRTRVVSGYVVDDMISEIEGELEGPVSMQEPLVIDVDFDEVVVDKEPDPSVEGSGDE